MNKELVFSELIAKGYNNANIYFSGGGDEGGAESITLTKLNGDKVDVSVWSASDSEDQSGLSSNVISELQQPIYDKYHAFAGEFYVWGNLIWDVANHKVYFEGSEENRITEPFREDL